MQKNTCPPGQHNGLPEQNQTTTTPKSKVVCILEIVVRPLLHSYDVLQHVYNMYMYMYMYMFTPALDPAAYRR